MHPNVGCHRMISYKNKEWKEKFGIWGTNNRTIQRDIAGAKNQSFQIFNFKNGEIDGPKLFCQYMTGALEVCMMKDGEQDGKSMRHGCEEIIEWKIGDDF